MTHHREQMAPVPPGNRHRERVLEAMAASPEAEAADKDPGLAYPVASPGAERASTEQLPENCRGHWPVGNPDHRARDNIFGKDACLMRTGKGLTNRASVNNLALAVVFHSQNPETDRTLADTRTRLQFQRDQVIKAQTAP